MNPEKKLPEWAPRVPQSLIRRLYETDARGIYDDELIDEVGWAFYMRCDSFIKAVDATQGRARCPACGETVYHHSGRDEVLTCACGWELPWRDYFQTLQHKQLRGAEPVLALFREFMQRFPDAEGPRQKMLLIDRLIHEFHRSGLKGGPTRTTGINLIGGRYHEVVEFLDRLTYGEGSTPGMRDTHARWRATIQDVAEQWGDERLRRDRE